MIQITVASRLKYLQVQPLHILGPPSGPQVDQDVTQESVSFLLSDRLLVAASYGMLHTSQELPLDQIRSPFVLFSLRFRPSSFCPTSSLDVPSSA